MSNQLTPASSVQLSPAARAAPAGGDLVLLHVGRGRYCTLNATGAWIWNQLAQPITLGEVRDALVEQFEVDAATAWNDLSALVAELVDEGLVMHRAGQEHPSASEPGSDSDS